MILRSLLCDLITSSQTHLRLHLAIVCISNTTLVMYLDGMVSDFVFIYISMAFSVQYSSKFEVGEIEELDDEL